MFFSESSKWLCFPPSSSPVEAYAQDSRCHSRTLVCPQTLILQKYWEQKARVDARERESERLGKLVKVNQCIFLWVRVCVCVCVCVCACLRARATGSSQRRLPCYFVVCGISCNSHKTCSNDIDLSPVGCVCVWACRTVVSNNANFACISTPKTCFYRTSGHFHHNIYSHQDFVENTAK